MADFLMPEAQQRIIYIVLIICMYMYKVMYKYMYVYKYLGLERIPDYPRTEHPDLFLCIWVLI